LTITGSADHLEITRPAQAGSATIATRAPGPRNAATTTSGAPANCGAHVGASAAHVGSAPDDETIDQRATDSAIAVASATSDAASLRTDTNAALTQMGWKPAIAHAAVAAAAASGPHATLEALIVAALQRCPRRTN